MKKLLTLLIFLPLFAYTQAVTLNLSQDARLGLIGDDKGNEAFTSNFNIGVELRGKQIKDHYFLLRPEYEYADLEGGAFSRVSSSFGVTFNKWVKNVDFTATAGGGLVTRHSLSGFHAVSNFQITYKITDNLGLFIDSEFLQRSDLAYDVIRYSGKLGIKIRLRQ